MNVSNKKISQAVKVVRDAIPSYGYRRDPISDNELHRIHSTLPLLYGSDPIVTTLIDEITNVRRAIALRTAFLTCVVLLYIIVCGVFPHIPGAQFIQDNSSLLNALSLSLFSIIRDTSWYWEILIHALAAIVLFFSFEPLAKPQR